MKTVAEADDETFAGTSIHKLELELLEEDYSRGQQLISESKMDEGEGWRLIVANGLAYLEGRQEMEKLNRLDVTPDVAAQVNNLAAQTLHLNGQYSAMKFKAFRFMQNMRVLEMNVAGLRGELAFSETTIPRLRDKVNELKAENEALKARLAQYEPVEDAAPAPKPVTAAKDEVAQPEPPGLLERLFGRR